MNYAIACEHYFQAHGRNLLICYYCEQHFLVSKALTKHILEKHLKDAGRFESVSVFFHLIEFFFELIIEIWIYFKAKRDLTEATHENTEQQQDASNIQANSETNSESVQKSTSTEKQLIESTPTVAENEVIINLDDVVEYASPNDEVDHDEHPNDEPLNLSVPKYDPDIISIIDLNNCVLDLSIKKKWTFLNRPQLCYCFELLIKYFVFWFLAKFDFEQNVQRKIIAFLPKKKGNFL